MISIILGTRPEIIKMSPVIRECDRKGIDYFILHTGQHYSYEMDRLFFEELKLPQPAYNLDAGSGSHSEQTGRIMTGIEKVLEKEKPDIVLVQGDTNTVLAGALAAAKSNIRIGHVEAGLRSFDRTMPEEINRIVADRISDYLFTPTDNARSNLIKEGISEDAIFNTGNTIVDAVEQNLNIAGKKDQVLDEHHLRPKGYFLATAHRQENVDNTGRLKEILTGLARINKKHSVPVLFPVHPRTAKRINEYGMNTDGIIITPPLGFLEFLYLEANAKLVLTDSGGVQEETCILGVPCITLRDNTERQETLEAGSNILAGANADNILHLTNEMLERHHVWKNPFGDGLAGKYIIDIIFNRFSPVSMN